MAIPQDSQGKDIVVGNRYRWPYGGISFQGPVVEIRQDGNVIIVDGTKIVVPAHKLVPLDGRVQELSS